MIGVEFAFFAEGGRIVIEGGNGYFVADAVYVDNDVVDEFFGNSALKVCYHEGSLFNILDEGFA